MGAVKKGEWFYKRYTYDFIPARYGEWFRLRTNGEKSTLTYKKVESDKIDGTKELEIVGVGYRFSQKGNVLVINAGYSNPVELQIPEGISIELPSNTELTIKGIEKDKVGEFAAKVRKVREPEPYKGKGIRYKDEHIIRKEGKKAA